MQDAYSLRCAPQVHGASRDALDYVLTKTLKGMNEGKTPEELVEEAVRLDLRAIALTDHDGLYGIVRFAEAAEATSVKTVFGAELSLDLPAPQKGVPDPVGSHLLVLARGEAGYHRLAGALTAAQLAGQEKGRPVYDLDGLSDQAGGDWVILTGCRKGAVRRDFCHRFGEIEIIAEFGPGLGLALGQHLLGQVRVTDAEVAQEMQKIIETPQVTHVALSELIIPAPEGQQAPPQ